jgi:hypothetical protein
VDALTREKEQERADQHGLLEMRRKMIEAAS